MGLSLLDVRQGLSDALSVLTGLNVVKFVPQSLTPPTAFVGFPQTIEFHRAMGPSDNEFRHFVIPVRVFCGLADAESSQEALASYLSGPFSIKAAIEADTTLNGVCQTLVVPSVTGFGLIYELAGTKYLGADWNVEVYG